MAGPALPEEGGDYDFFMSTMERLIEGASGGVQQFGGSPQPLQVPGPASLGPVGEAGSDYFHSLMGSQANQASGMFGGRR
jgi:hypothetical protein